MTKRFDYVTISIGYSTYAVPKDFAYKLLDAAQGENFYKVDTDWVDSKSRLLIHPVAYDEMPRISVMNPVDFFTGIENYKMKEEEKARAKKDAT